MTDKPSTRDVRSLFDAYVADFNEGIRTNDRQRMLARFSPEAVLEFQGVPVGPFHGREAIAAAYAQMPPDDEVDILDAEVTGEDIVAIYAWRRDRGVAAGRMLLDTQGGLVTKLVVTFEPVIVRSPEGARR